MLLFTIKCNNLSRCLKNHGNLLDVISQLRCCDGQNFCDSSLCQVCYQCFATNVICKAKKNPHFVLGTNRGGLVIEWGRLLNSQNFRRNSIVRIDHCILFIVIECNLQVCQLKSFYYKNNPF